MSFSRITRKYSICYSYFAIVIVIISTISLSFFGSIILVVSSSAAGSETLIGIKGKDFVLLATSSGISGNGVAFTSTYIDKIHLLQPSYANTDNVSADDGDTSSNTGTATSSDSTAKIGRNLVQHPPFLLSRPGHVRIPTIAIAAVGNYADVDHMIRRVRAEYNIYHYESLTYSTTTAPPPNSKNAASISTARNFELIDCHPNLFHSIVSTHTEVPPPPLDDTDSDNDDLDIAMATLLSVNNVAHMVRNQIMSKLRSATPYHICTLIAGIRPRQYQQHIHVENHGDGRDTTTFAFSPSLTTPATTTYTTIGRKNIGEKTELAEQLQNQVRIASTSNGMLSDKKIKSIDANRKNHFTNLNDIENVTEPGNETHNEPSEDDTRTYEPVLYWLDEYGSMIDQIPYGVHGYASDMIYSILDQKYHAAMSKEEAVQLLNECIQQLQTRYMMNTQQQQSSLLSSTNTRKSFCIKLIDQYGCTQL